MKTILRAVLLVALAAMLVVHARAGDPARVRTEARVMRAGDAPPLPEWWYPGLDSVIVVYSMTWETVYTYRWDTSGSPIVLVAVDTAIVITSENADTTFYD